MELPNRATDLPEPLLTYLVKLLMFGLKSHLKVGLLLTKGECLRDEVDNMTKAPQTTLFDLFLTPAPATCKCLHAGIVVLSIIEDEAANLRNNVVLFAHSPDRLGNILSSMWSFKVAKADKRSLNRIILVDKVCNNRIKAKVVPTGPEIEGEMYIGSSLV
jgi:hypothetical protein